MSDQSEPNNLGTVFAKKRGTVEALQEPGIQGWKLTAPDTHELVVSVIDDGKIRWIPVDELRAFRRWCRESLTGKVFTTRRGFMLFETPRNGSVGFLQTFHLKGRVRVHYAQGRWFRDNHPDTRGINGPCLPVVRDQTAE
jgi:hypothetical protein